MKSLLLLIVAVLSISLANSHLYMNQDLQKVLDEIHEKTDSHSDKPLTKEIKNELIEFINIKIDYLKTMKSDSKDSDDSLNREYDTLIEELNKMISDYSETDEINFIDRVKLTITKIKNDLKDKYHKVHLKVNEEIENSKRELEHAKDKVQEIVKDIKYSFNDIEKSWGKIYIALSIILPLMLSIIVYYRMKNIAVDIDEIKDKLNKLQ